MSYRECPAAHPSRAPVVGRRTFTLSLYSSFDMTRSRTDISVVICTYTEARWDDLVAAVASVQRQTVAPREIIVVVDHNPLVLARARAYFMDRQNVVVIENSGERGISDARTCGFAATRGAIIACLDDDAVATPDWLERLSAGYEDPRVLVTGGKIVPSWDSGRPFWFPEEFDWVVGCTYKGMPDTQVAVRNLISCNMSLRREAFEAVGGFNSGIGRLGALPIGCEETEWCIRVGQRFRDKVLLYDPAAIVHHHVPVARARWGYFIRRCYAEGLSKALVAHAVGRGDALSAERAYATRVLPAAVARNMYRAMTRHDMAGVVRAAAIVLGLSATATGYVTGTATALASRGRKAHKAHDDRCSKADAAPPSGR